MLERIGNLDDYLRLKSSFRWERPEYFNFGYDVVDRWASTHPDSHALHWHSQSISRSVTFSELAARSAQVAAAVANLGVQPGDRVLVVLPRILPWWETLVGLIKAGIVAIPGTTLLTAKDLAYRITAADIAAVITDEAGAPKIDQIAPQCPQLKHHIQVGGATLPGWHDYEDLVGRAQRASTAARTRADAPALLFFTSGTTGMPKMVLHSHASYGMGHAITGRLWLDLQPGDLHWNISDTGWAKAAWSNLFGPWICGASLFIQDSRGRFQPADVLRALADFPITTLCAAPTIYRMLVQEDLSGFKPQALRHCVAAGEPLNPAVINVWRTATGLTIRDGYGQTETVLLCGNFPGIDVRTGSMGLPSPGFDLAVIDVHGTRLPPGEVGDIAVRIDPERPVGMFREYWRNAEAMAASFRDGWYVTGDTAYVDADGYFWFVGRADEVITSSAYRIGPFEVESALIEHPAVVETAVVGKPDPVRGEIVKAFVVLAQGYEPGDALVAELQEHTKTVTAPYKSPREIEFLSELPKTTSGKIRRGELKRRSKM